MNRVNIDIDNHNFFLDNKFIKVYEPLVSLDLFNYFIINLCTLSIILLFEN